MQVADFQAQNIKLNSYIELTFTGGNTVRGVFADWSMS